MSNKSFGLKKERHIIPILREEGSIFVTRQRGSFGFADVIAFFKNYCLLVSVKSTKQKYYSYKKEIEKLKKIKVPKYCKKQLRIWLSPNKDRKIYKGWIVIDI